MELTDEMLEGARAAWNTSKNVDRWLSQSDLRVIIAGAISRVDTADAVRLLTKIHTKARPATTPHA